ncbi:1-(5-phosphoribosyl)-5-((5-phosphoribosylamino)methylideneamino)imidazole-4-carboxamide isomerase [Bacterioplanes sanyensis]|uniref:1-(5-phosphoribosyl)-5-((5-phosphoribosylamino)methylideneamino)imidazole-4-carboxamide isomerase n=1 Tax=Bacterioplanes sanyensis TaxID=1249553 RepID=A0A222FIF4_9GAMM|nr:DUF971 domain-containing protein [Bacterioplanes sanyensis]ASP38376.1 1-(5-phosphoribosyl)-5-((5-phosphoribosylamino)methylideneamino)imidazole-4-carboxamide isomerase [Bacterioplanes sanyensis]
MIPAAIKVQKTSRTLQLSYADGDYQLSFEFLRVFSPSAEVRGHGTGNGVLQYGKKDVALLRIEPAGNYALKLVFDDGHDSGLYDWKYLRHLCDNQSSLWQEYLQQLEAAGQERSSNIIQFKAL